VPTRAEVENAIRVADSQGRKADVRQLGAYLQSMDDTSLTDKAIGVGETLLTMGTGYGAKIGSGAAGLLNLAVTQDPAQATQDIQEFQREHTYQPRSNTGQDYSEAMGNFFDRGLDWMEERTGVAGRGLSEAVLDISPLIIGGRAPNVVEPKPKTVKPLAVKDLAEVKPVDDFTPKRTFLGSGIDSIFLRLKQKLGPDSVIPMEFRKFEVDRNIKMSEYDPLVEIFAKAENAMPRKQREVFHDAWNAQDKPAVMKMMEEVVGPEVNNKFWIDYEAAMSNRYTELKGAGLKINEVEGYLPRMVTDLDAFMKGSSTKLQAQLKGLSNDFKEGKLTEAEYTDAVNTAITEGGVPIVSAPVPRPAKHRAAREGDPARRNAYARPSEALRNYFNETGSSIAERQFLGKADTIEGSIGSKLTRDIEEGKLNPSQAEDVRAMLQVRFSGAARRGPHKLNSFAKDVGYLGTIAQLSSAATQLGDAFISYGRHGLHTNKAILKSMMPKKVREKQGTLDPYDIGYGDIMQELIGSPSKIRNILDTGMKRSGFKMIDRFGKRTMMNASMSKFKKWAGNPRGIKELEKKGYRRLLGDEEFVNFVNDLRTGKMDNPNVRFAIANELAEVQPIHMIDMPIAYLKHPNGRIVYSLKTWAIRQLNRMREDVMEGNYKDFAKYAMGVYVSTNSVDLSKKFIQSIYQEKPLTQEDVTNESLDNLLKIVGANRYQMKKSHREGPMGPLWDALKPPTLGIMDNLYLDIKNWDNDEAKIRSISNIPIVGRMLDAEVNK